MDIEVQRVGDRWVFSDGTVLPVVSGGADDDAFIQGVVESGSGAIDDGFVGLPDGGVMTGVEPAQQVPPITPTQPSGNPPNQPAEQGRTFTQAEVERIRKEERDKLYADLEKERTRRKELEKTEKERKAEDDARAAQLAEDARLAAEAEMDAKQLIESRTADFEARLAEERRQREMLEATLDQERHFMQLNQYRSQRVATAQEDILPELLDLVGGNTEEEIDASIDSLRARTASILGNVQQTVASVRQGMQGASVTAPPVGPMEQQSQQQSISAEDIRNMTAQEYAQHRDRLLGAMRQQVRDQGGIYGPR